MQVFVPKRLQQELRVTENQLQDKWRLHRKFYSWPERWNDQISRTTDEKHYGIVPKIKNTEKVQVGVKGRNRNNMKLGENSYWSNAYDGEKWRESAGCVRNMEKDGSTDDKT